MQTLETSLDRLLRITTERICRKCRLPHQLLKWSKMIADTQHLLSSREQIWCYSDRTMEGISLSGIRLSFRAHQRRAANTETMHIHVFNMQTCVPDDEGEAWMQCSSLILVTMHVNPPGKHVRGVSACSQVKMNAETMASRVCSAYRKDCSH